MENTIDYKQTINLPKTDFSMKADLPKKEPLILLKWHKLDIYNKIIEQSKDKPKYILHDGPPYANGNIHIGHALNKILKDITNKYKTLRGFCVPFIPGWDCHGLPVEHQLFKELGLNKDDIDQVEFRKKAHDFAMKFVAVQKEEFKRLGIFGDWENPYLTLSPLYEAAIIRSFGQLVDKGYIYKGCKPVNWCYSCETALAEAEVEYEEHTSPSVYVKFALTSKPKAAGVNIPEDRNYFIAIWTTTPWTLLGNVACSVHPDFNYVLVEAGKEVLIMEENLSGAVLEKSGLSEYKIIACLKGKHLEHIEYEHPFSLRKGKIVLADYVSCEDGTGIVHTAPGYGSEDFLTGKRYNLDVLMQVDKQGRFFKDIKDFGNLHVFKANKLIIEKLEANNVLLHCNKITHSYPHCWRCKQPILFRATEQWFMSIDHNKLRNKLLQMIKKVSWVPSFGESRISDMVENRPDWCLSRQRLWGVPIPVFYCKNCKIPILDKKVIDNFAKIVETEGTDSWFIKSAKEILLKGFSCPKCKKAEFEKEKDILDVWFDSGVSHQAVVKNTPQLQYPSDLYLEGSDQHRGWFQAALITAAAIDECAPFKAVLTHGFTVDGEGKKMSKSRGNVIAPQQVISKLGADVLRLAIASSDYNDDVRLSQEILARVSESYRKIRNTLKFILGNLYDFDPQTDFRAYEQLREIDRWALSALHKLLDQVTQAYDNFIFHQANKLIYQFCIIEMSSFYLDVLKDTLYTCAATSQDRRSAQTVLYEILSTLTRIIAPVLSFTAEEAYDFIPKDKAESIFLKQWPKLKPEYINEGLNDTWKIILNLRNCVLKVLEEARSSKLIGNSLEAKITIYCSESCKQMSKILKTYKQQLPGIFIVSAVELNMVVDTMDLPVYNVDFPKQNGQIKTAQVKIKAERAQGTKCIRCWNYSQDVGKDKQHAKLCQRCISNIAA